MIIQTEATASHHIAHEILPIIWKAAQVSCRGLSESKRETGKMSDERVLMRVCAMYDHRSIELIVAVKNDACCITLVQPCHFLCIAPT